MKKLLIILSLVLTSGLFFASSVHAGSPSVVGTWNVTFFLEPTRSTGSTQCIVFTSVPGTVAGVATSGKWYSPTFPSWSGQWIQLGDHVRWFGVTGGLATAESGNVQNGTNFTGVSFNHFASSNATTSSAGTWRAVRTTRCALDTKVGGQDPAGITQ